MSKRVPKLNLDEVVIEPDVDLETEAIFDSDGRRIDQAYVDEVVEEFNRRGAGRPSLSGEAAKSPLIQVRVSPEVKAFGEAAAEERGITLSEWVRWAIDLGVAATSPAEDAAQAFIALRARANDQKGKARGLA